MIKRLELDCFAKQDANTKFVNLFTVVNQLVDAVNELQISANRMEFDKPKENKQDPCAEVQKWVGCICRFWYDNSNDTCLDYLDKVQMGKDGLEYRGKETYDWYPYCEPVLPTDKAIYKGGKDEN